jgi:hypothetical protein
MNLMKQELRRKSLPYCLAVGKGPVASSLLPSQPYPVNSTNSTIAPRVL